MARSKLVLCDSDVLIRLLKKDVKAYEALKKIGFENLRVSIITVAEIYRGARKDELPDVRATLSKFRILHLEPTVSKVFHGLVIDFTHERNLKIPDALIAATSISNQMELFTFNVRDFDFIPDLRLYRP